MLLLIIELTADSHSVPDGGTKQAEVGSSRAKKPFSSAVDNSMPLKTFWKFVECLNCG